MSRLDTLRDSIINGDAAAAKQGVEQALSEGIDPHAILNEGLIAAMGEVGELFEEGVIFIPEMLIAGRAMQAGLVLLKELLIEGETESMGTIAIGAVQGDLHDIGKNLVSMMLEGAGFTIKDLGVDAPPESFVAAVREGVDIIALSALLTTTMTSMERTIQALIEAGLRDRVKVMIGGAPVTQAYAEMIGADGYSDDANGAVRVAKHLINRS